MLLAVFDALALGGQCTQSRLVFRPLGIGHQVAPVDPVRVLVAPPLAILIHGAIIFCGATAVHHSIVIPHAAHRALAPLSMRRGTALLAILREGAGRHDAQQHARTRTFQSSWSSPVSPFIGADR